MRAASCDELTAQAKNTSDPTQRHALLDEAAKWDEGGAYRSLAHAAVGGLTGGVSGAAGAGAAALSANAINKATADLPSGVKSAVGAAIASGIGAAVGGGSVAGVTAALNEDLKNRQLHPTEAALIKANAAKFAKQLNDGKEPTQAQIDAAQELLTSTTLNQIDSSFDKRITTEDAQVQTFLKGLASQYGNVDVGGGKLFDARGTAAFNNHTTNAQYLGQTAPLYNQLDSKDLKGVSPNVGGAYVAYGTSFYDGSVKSIKRFAGRAWEIQETPDYGQ